MLGSVARDRATAGETAQCVYAHVSDVQPEQRAALEEALGVCKVKRGSTAGLELQRSLLDALAADRVRALAYVGMTTSSTVDERREIFGYGKHTLMRATWEALETADRPASTLLGFADDHATSGPALEIMEFAIVEMLGTFGRGFNLQPGGPFTYSKRRWVTYSVAKAFMAEKGVATQTANAVACVVRGEWRRAGEARHPI